MKFFAALGIIALFVLSFLLGRHTAGKQGIIEKTDTLIVVDTVRIAQPVPVEVRVTDTMLVAVTDTVRQTDTVYVRVPKETKTYEGKDYKAQVSGYRPSLDWIEVYPETKYITKFVTPRKRWGIGVQVGYGAMLHDRQAILSPYVGVGISSNLLVW